MPRRTFTTTWKALAVLCGMFLAIGGAIVACGSDNGATVGNSDGGNNGEGGNGEGGVCQAGGSSCTSNADCCSSNCDTTKNQCVGGLPGCTGANDTCSVATDCCSLSCQSGKCSAAQCISDNQACTANDQCCGGVCGSNGKCTPLNNSCLTAGNSCTAGGEQCCSTLCSGGVCQLSASFCIQAGDVCAKSSDCCTGTCTIAAGATLGTCGTLPNLGQNNCSGGVDGTVCGGVSTDGGNPGDCTACCSRLCAPYAPTGVFICQPANGCHVEGDLCAADSDCCGGEALLPDGGDPVPGAGKVVCLKAAGAPIGYCSTPSAGNGGVGGTCNPEGDVCHFQNYYCSGSSKRDDCCPDPANKTTCQLDPLGIPRCQVLGGDAGTMACVPTTGECAFDSDCCTGKCLPDSTGKLTCNPVTCSPASGPCTTTADCCGGNCNVPPGSLTGTCGTTTNTNPDGGTCKAYGQSCSQASDCCNGVPCTNGSCQYPPR